MLHQKKSVTGVRDSDIQSLNMYNTEMFCVPEIVCWLQTTNCKHLSVNQLKIIVALEH